MTSKPPATTEQTPKADSKSNVRATVTGLDSEGQLFRDNSRVVLLKGRKCVCVVAAKPARDGSVIIEMRVGAESWRSDAKVRSVTAAASDPGSFQVTLEMDRASDLVIEPAEAEAPPPPAPRSEPKVVTPRPDPVEDAPRLAAAEIRQPTQEFASPASYAVPELPAPPPAARRTPPLPPEEAPAPVAPTAPAFAAAPADPLRPAHAGAASRTAITEVVRSVLSAEVEELKQDLPDMIAEQIATALRHPLEKIEAKVERNLRKQPALSEDFVRKAAAEAAEHTQIEWAATSQDLIAETVRAAVSADGQQQRRDLRRLVAGEMEAALRGTLTARIDARINETVDARLDENLRVHTPVTEETVRQLATQIAESIQLRWASTRLQKMVAEAVRAALAAEREQRRAEALALVSEKLDDVLLSSLEARMDAALEKVLAARVDHYLESPAAAGARKGARSGLLRHPAQEEDAAGGDAAEPTPQARIATETLANQIVSDVQRRLSTFSAAMSELVASRRPTAAAATPAEQDPAPADEKTLAEQLQSAGTSFEHEVEEAIHKAFGKRFK